QFREDNTRPVDSYAEFKKMLEDQGGFLLAHWNGDRKVEEQIKTETKATIRGIPLDGAAENEPGKCMITGQPSARRVIFALSY
ncbi:MAG: proline--tRNA ligase, partial [Deltaproteobacteria bacterium]|nr:proline--tRNA ligase [Deltaproteobacteria bacterium]